MKKISLLLILLLTGCASADIVPIGTNTYLISQTSSGGIFTNVGKLKTDVIKRANSFAESRGKVAVPISSTTTRPIVAGMPNFEYQFVLVDRNDPRALNIQAIPDTIRR